MADRVYEYERVRILECSTDGEQLRGAGSATEIIGAASSARVSLVVIPAPRLGDDFFHLRTGIAGEIMQKFVTYGVRLAILGDISAYLAESSALRDLVYECNKGSQIWFLPDSESLANRLAGAGRVSQD